MFVKPRPTDRILDLGCGPADIVDKLNGCQYVGVDHDPGYIARARKKYNGRSQFHLASIADIDVIEPSSFDIVLSIGVLHHLADAEALHLFQVARESLKPTGRLVTVDGCLTHPQKRLRRFFRMSQRIRCFSSATVSSGIARLYGVLFRDCPYPPKYSHVNNNAFRRPAL